MKNNIATFSKVFVRQIGISVAILVVVDLIAKADEAMSAKKLREQYRNDTLKYSNEYEAGAQVCNRYGTPKILD